MSTGLVVAPGFIDVHTHDDLICITQPEMIPKISQGVTTLIVGNCGISAAPLRFANGVSEPFNLLGQQQDFAYDSFASYRAGDRSGVAARERRCARWTFDASRPLRRGSRAARHRARAGRNECSVARRRWTKAPSA